MPKYKLKGTDEFEKQFNKFPQDIKNKFEKQFKKVKKDPYGIGKPLGYKWFRELKNKKSRVYYLIYEKEIIVLFVGISDKKNQQEIIEFVTNNLKIFDNIIHDTKTI